MVEPVAVAGGVRVHLEHRAPKAAKRVLVHDDGDPRRLETMPLVRGVFLHGNPEAGTAAAEQVPHGQDRPREVRRRPKAARGLGRDRQGRSLAGHRIIV